MAEGLSLVVFVPSDGAGKIIGKAGSGLKQIRQMSQCSVQLHQEPDANGYRKADVVGPTVEHIASAVHAISIRLFPEGQQECTLNLAFPNELVGAVIGKGGENLKRIREMTGIKLQIEKDAFTESQERIGSITGDQKQLGAAMRIAYSTVGAELAGAPPAQAAPYYTSASSTPMPKQMQSMPQVSMPSPVISQVRKASGAANEWQLHFVIPGKFIGAILGKEGTQIKQVQAESGCLSVSATKRDQPGERRVVIVGGWDECLSAQQAVFGHYSKAAADAQEAVTDVTIIFMVPNSTAGAVIGKEAGNLKTIRETNSVKINLQREEVEGFRPCTITGQFESVVSAERTVHEQVVAQLAEPGNGVKRRPEDAFAEPVKEEAEAYEAKRPRTLPSGQVATGEQTKMLVPGRSAGAIIGKQGSKLKEIRESSGAHIEVLSQERAPQWLSERLVIVKGSLQVRQQAIQQVLQAAWPPDQSQEAVELKLLIQKAAAGGVIGKAANNLKVIRETCSVSVKVEREEMMGDRLVSATGQMGPILAACSMVLEFAESGPPSAGGMTPSSMPGAMTASPYQVGLY